MATGPIRETAAGLDLTPRVQASNAPLLAPGLDREVEIMYLTLPSEPAVIAGVLLFAFVQMQGALSATSTQLRIRRTDKNGQLVVASGAIPTTPLALFTRNLIGFDPGPVGSQQVYALTSESVGATAATPNFQTTFVAIVI